MTSTVVADHLLSRLHSAFVSSTQRNQIYEIPIELAGHAAGIKFSGPVVRDKLLPALRGLQTNKIAPPAPGLTVHVWDGSAGGSFPWPELQDDLRKYPDKVSVINSGDSHLQYNPEGGILSLIDVARQTAFYFVAEPENLPDYEVCTPMRMLMNWFCDMHGLLFVHAAAVGHAGSCALLIGKSGAGKSTTSLHCLLHGLDYLGDDYLAVSKSTPAIAYPIYRGCKVMDDALMTMPELQPHVLMRNTKHKKSVVILPDNSYKLSGPLPISAIVRPSIDGSEKTAFAPIDVMQVIREFAGSTILQMPGTGQNMLRELTRLCAGIPCYGMQLGTDAVEIADSMRSFLNRFSMS